MRPEITVSNTVVALVMAWVGFILIDIVQLAGPAPQPRPIWTRLFNDGPVEWIQWFLLPTAVLTGSYLSSRLRQDGDRGAASFFLLFAVGAGLMLIEDAGDIRHVLGAYVIDAFGSEVAGLPINLFAEVPYFLLLAAVPLYALVRYGRHAWRAPRVRRYLFAGYGLYAVAGTASGLRVVGDTYIRLGRWVDEVLLGSRFPVPDGQTENYAHFYLIDGPFEESIETVAAACFLAIVLSFAADYRAGRVTPDERAGSAPQPGQLGRVAPAHSGDSTRQSDGH
jgi:hypothetical protein